MLMSGDKRNPQCGDKEKSSSLALQARFTRDALYVVSLHTSVCLLRCDQDLHCDAAHDASCVKQVLDCEKKS